MQLAAEWFSGKEIPEVRYLPIRIITKENVDDYLPPQW
jgi:ribose transport system substrate-binding protein